MSDSNSYIEGIYNYCDRWCERCKYTDRCFSFQRELEAGLDPLDRDIPQEKVWEYVGKCLADAMVMLYEIAEREGLDLDSLPEVEEMPPSEKAARFKADTKVLYDDYLTLTRRFFEQNSAYFEEKGHESIRWVEMGLDSEEATVAQWQRVDDQADVIKWYMPFIGAKLARAGSGIDGMYEDHWDGPEQSDANRTARILMVAIDRSIAAWRVMLHVFPEKEEAILRALSLLARLRLLTEGAFPRWREAGPDVEW